METFFNLNSGFPAVLAVSKKGNSPYFTVMKSTFMKGSLINFLRTLSTKKAGWVPFNEKVKVLTVEGWDGLDH